MKISILTCAMVLLVSFSGCGHRFVGWEKDHLYQGEIYFPDKDDPQSPKKIIERNIRTLRVYDEFDTLGIFDVLWLSDEVRRTYIELHVRRLGLSPEIEQQLLARQLAEHDTTVSFYVMAYAPGTTMPLDEEGNAVWSVMLKTPSGNVQPRSVRSVDLVPEYKYLLGNYLSKYKTLYLVKFETTARPFELVFTLPDRNACLSWMQPPPPVEQPVFVKKAKRKSKKERDCLRTRSTATRINKELI